jgi:hypothetical protein
VDLVEDTAAPAVDTAAAAMVADAQATDGSSGAVSEKLTDRVVDATNAIASVVAVAVPVGAPEPGTILSAEADAVLNARAAADALLACQPVKLAAAREAKFALSADSDLRAELRNAWKEARPDRQHSAWARVLGPLPLNFVGPLLARPVFSATSVQDPLPTQLVTTVLTASSEVASYSTEYGGGGEEEVSSSPVITSFRATMGVSNILFLEGEVHYRDPSSLVVIFGGLPNWCGTNPRPDGTFSYTLFVPSGFHNIISAQAFSPMEEVSNVVYDWV